MPLLRAAMGLALLPLALLALPEVAAAVCPNYPYPPLTDRCRRNPYCGWIDVEGSTILDGVLEATQPAPLQGESLDPIAFSHEAIAGSADLSAIGRAEMETAPGFVRAFGNADADAPRGELAASSNANYEVLAVTRVGDLVFSGPSAEVETSLHLVFDGSFSQVTTGIEGATAISSVTAFLGGGVCGQAEPFGFGGERTVTQLDDNDFDDHVVLSVNQGVLENVELDALSEIVVGPFTVPTREPLELELWLQSNVSAATGGGNTDSTGDFSLAIGPIGDGPVFDLPAGYTVDSEGAGIVANRVPEPSAGLAAVLSALALLFRARRKSQGAIAAQTDSSSR